ncbi:MAG: hypothetical protein NZ571_11755 [Anaerolineae bacterium]|nr:hypothetical protein [Anaerolineae bacterium]
MVRRIGLWLLCSVLLLSALSGVARALGSGQSAEWRVIFTTPSGEPCHRLCLFGVMPARHTPEEAVEILQAHPLTRSWTHSAPFRFESRRSGHTLAVSFSVFADGILDTITLSVERDAKSAPMTSPLQLGDLLSAFGAPDYLHLGAQIDPLLIYVPKRLMLNVKLGEARRLTPESPIKRLTLFRFGICPSSAPLYTFSEWRGLTHQARQLASPLVQRYVRRVFGAQVTLIPC